MPPFPVETSTRAKLTSPRSWFMLLLELFFQHQAVFLAERPWVQDGQTGAGKLEDGISHVLSRISPRTRLRRRDDRSRSPIIDEYGL